MLVVVLWDPIRLALSGQFNDVIQKTEKVTYQGNTNDNLKAIRTALLLYHDNEDHFPEASGWMDAIAPMLRTNDLQEGEEWKKLKNPSLGGLSADEYGYAMSEEVAGRNRADLQGDPILVFESPKNRAKNAAGDPTVEKGHQISLKGTLK